MNKLLPIALLLIATTNLSAQDIQFVKKGADFGATPPNPQFYNHVGIGNKLYFSNANKLYVTDGTNGGTELLKTFGGSEIVPIVLRVVNGKLLFIANDGVHGRELWTSDGTAAGTQLLVDINNGMANGIPDYVDRSTDNILPVLQNTAFFYGDNGTNGIELWKTDGTVAGTQMVVDLNTNAGAGIRDLSYHMQMVVYNNKLYFQGRTATDDEEVWSSDGTAAGTQKAFDINTGSDGSGAGAFAVFNNKLMFSAYELIAPPSTFTVPHVYIYDGTNVQAIIDSTTSIENPEYVVIGNKIFFHLTFGQNMGLYVSDGTKAGTTLLSKDFIGNGNGAQNNGKRLNLAQANGLATFLGKTSTTTDGLWVSDGTINSTQQIFSNSFTSQNYATQQNISFGNKSYFRMYDTSSKNAELWQTDGTTQGTVKLSFPNADYTIPSPIVYSAISRSPLMVYGTHMYFFNTYTNAEGLSLYKIGMWPNSIETIITKDAVTIYPNPTNNNATINTELKTAQALSVDIIDLTGKTVQKQAAILYSAGRVKIPVASSTLPEGTYIISLNNSEGQSTWSSKFVKQ